MRSNTKKVIGFTVAAAAIGVAAVFLYRTEQPLALTPVVKAEAPAHPTGETSPTISSSPAISTEGRTSYPNTIPPPVTQSSELPAPAMPHPRLGGPQAPPEPPYIPSPEEQQRFDELKSKAYSPGMTMSKLLKREEFGTLPEPMRKQLFHDLMTMAMRGELDRKQFLEE